MKNYLNIIRKIDLLKDYIKIDEIKMGNPERIKIKVTTNKKEFFVKIIQDTLDENYIDKMTWLYKQYKKLDINFAKLIDIYVFADKKISVLVFDYIKGKTLSLLKMDNLEYERYGIKVANYSLKLKSIPIKNKDTLNIEQLTYDYIKKIRNLKNELTKLELIDENTINLIEEKLIKLSNTIKNDKPHYIHGDVKTDNFIIDENKELCITDIDYILPSYYFLDVRWIILKAVLSEECNERYFLRGFLKTIYKDEPVDNFENKMLYVILINLISSSEEYLEDKNKLLMYYDNIINIIENKNHFIYKLLFEF